MPTLRNRQATAPPPSSPSIRRRVTRATSHLGDTAPSPASAPSQEPTAPSSSAESTPDTEVKVELIEEEEKEEEMLHREGASRRSKNIEDVNDVEEKGLYGGYSSGNRDDDVREKLLAERDRSPSEEREGLSSRRDKEAFALLVVLCEYDL
jgi:hypothetical protein